MPYSKSVALIGSIALASIAQIHGFHRCYVNEWGTGILMCVTLGGCWIWSIIDWLNIGRIVDEANGRQGYLPWHS